MTQIERQLTLASGDLISISQAAKKTPYSAEYLSLLARKGKLPAIKISRDWLTTRGAVVQYVNNQMDKHAKIMHALQKSQGRAA